MGWFSKEPKLQYYGDEHVNGLIKDLMALKVHEGHLHVLGVRALADEFGILVQDSETCIAIASSLHLQWRKPQRSNLRIFNYGRILGDIRYRYERQPEEELLAVGVGFFLVTTDRLVFFPTDNGESLSIKLPSLLSVQILDTGAIEVRCTSRKKPLVIQFTDGSEPDELNFTAVQTAKLFKAYIVVATEMGKADIGGDDDDDLDGHYNDDPLIEEIDDIDQTIIEDDDESM